MKFRRLTADNQIHLRSGVGRMFSHKLMPVLAIGALLVGGCGKNGSTATPPANGNGLTKIRVGYIGLTCEAPIFTAVEKGFFKEEGLDVRWSNASGRITRTCWRWAGLT